MRLQGLIDRGKIYIKATAKNINEKQSIANEWFGDVMNFLNAEYGKTKFFSAIQERLLGIWGYDSLGNQSDLDGDSGLPLIQEMELKVKDYIYRIELVLKELENICVD